MDYYTALRRETVKSARFDPLIFLYAHLGDEGAFDGHVFSPNLKNVPVLMRLTNDDHISLSITEWYDEISVFDKHTSTAHSTPVESGELLWEFDGDAWERSDYMPDSAERFSEETTLEPSETPTPEPTPNETQTPQPTVVSGTPTPDAAPTPHNSEANLVTTAPASTRSLAHTGTNSQLLAATVALLLTAGITARRNTRSKANK